MITVERYHDISCGHRVSGHPSKCNNLHGHNYRIHFVVTAPDLDQTGMIMDFAIIKSRLCDWLETHYDHKFLIWEQDELARELVRIHPGSIVLTTYNPTAENIAKYLCEVVAVEQLAGTDCELIECRVEETRKCSATYRKVRTAAN